MLAACCPGIPVASWPSTRRSYLMVVQMMQRNPWMERGGAVAFRRENARAGLEEKAAARPEAPKDKARGHPHRAL
jgi:hypothetical protein